MVEYVKVVGLGCLFALLVCGCQQRLTSEDVEMAHLLAGYPRGGPCNQMSGRPDQFPRQTALGTVHIDLVPDEGTLQIDGGKVQLANDQLLLPVGTYLFHVVWSDGREKVERIFIPAGESHLVLSSER